MRVIQNQHIKHTGRFSFFLACLDRIIFKHDSWQYNTYRREQSIKVTPEQLEGFYKQAGTIMQGVIISNRGQHQNVTSAMARSSFDHVKEYDL